MKKFIASLLILACLNLPMAGTLHAGEVQKKPLKTEEMVELAREQVKDYQETRNTEAGMKDGYGLLTIALVGVVAYVIVEQANDD